MLVATDAEQVQGGEGVAINGQTQTTLFFTGLPTGMDQQNVASLFEQFGNVSSVVLHHNKVGRCHHKKGGLDGCVPTSLVTSLYIHTQLSGVVEFDNASYIKDVLTAARAGEECVVSLADDGGTASRGIKALVEAHKHCYRPKGGNEALATHLNEYVVWLWCLLCNSPATHCASLVIPPHTVHHWYPPPSPPTHRHIIKLEAEAKQREQEALRAQADDGWTVVVRGKVCTL